MTIAQYFAIACIVFGASLIQALFGFGFGFVNGFSDTQKVHSGCEQWSTK
jgi:hypothetical protein